MENVSQIDSPGTGDRIEGRMEGVEASGLGTG